ncbi:CoxG family protein [Cupriavidus basilensis]
MEMTQTRQLPVARQDAWEALNDTGLLKQCIPGCESIEPDGDNAYLVALTAAVGPVKARFKGRMALQDIQAPDSYTIQFDGQGGVAGFGKGTARVTLAPEGEQTVLTYTVNAQVGGKLAQIGSRLVDAAARKMAIPSSTASRRRCQAGPASKVTKRARARDVAKDGAAAGDGSTPDEQTGETKRKRSWTAWISKS